MSKDRRTIFQDIEENKKEFDLIDSLKSNFGEDNVNIILANEEFSQKLINHAISQQNLPAFEQIIDCCDLTLEYSHLEEAFLSSNFEVIKYIKRHYSYLFEEIKPRELAEGIINNNQLPSLKYLIELFKTDQESLKGITNHGLSTACEIDNFNANIFQFLLEECPNPLETINPEELVEVIIENNQLPSLKYLIELFKSDQESLRRITNFGLSKACEMDDFNANIFQILLENCPNLPFYNQFYSQDNSNLLNHAISFGEFQAINLILDFFKNNNIKLNEEYLEESLISALQLANNSFSSTNFNYSYALVKELESLLKQSQNEEKKPQIQNYSNLTFLLCNNLGEINPNFLDFIIQQEKFDLSRTDYQGNNLAHILSHNGEFEALKILENKIDLNKGNHQGNTPLLMAAISPSLEPEERARFIVNLTINLTSKINLKHSNNNNENLINILSKDAANLELIKDLLKYHNFDLNLKSQRNNRSALENALAAKDEELIMLLINHGCQIPETWPNINFSPDSDIDKSLISKMLKLGIEIPNKQFASQELQLLRTEKKFSLEERKKNSDIESSLNKANIFIEQNQDLLNAELLHKKLEHKTTNQTLHSFSFMDLFLKLKTEIFSYLENPNSENKFNSNLIKEFFSLNQKIAEIFNQQNQTKKQNEILPLDEEYEIEFLNDTEANQESTFKILSYITQSLYQSHSQFHEAQTRFQQHQDQQEELKSPRRNIQATNTTNLEIKSPENQNNPSRS